MTQKVNDQLVLLVGKSATGKSASLMNLRDPEGVLYLNCEAGKRLPFKSGFKEHTVVDPLQVIEAFQRAEAMPEIHTIVVDSLTYMMDMFESVYVVNSANTMKAWGDYNQFFKELMQKHVAASTKNVIFIAHTTESVNGDYIMETYVPVKGALKNNGIESYFSTVIACKTVPLKQLDGYKNDMLNITEDDEMLGFKYVFQTRKTKDTVGERLRGPIHLFSKDQTYTDNDMQMVLDHMHKFYNN